MLTNVVELLAAAWCASALGLLALVRAAHHADNAPVDYFDWPDWLD